MANGTCEEETQRHDCNMKKTLANICHTSPCSVNVCYPRANVCSIILHGHMVRRIDENGALNDSFKTVSIAIYDIPGII